MQKSILRKAALLAAPVALVAGLTGATLAQSGSFSDEKPCYKLEMVQV
jgi:hypothetical protein